MAVAIFKNPLKLTLCILISSFLTISVATNKIEKNKFDIHNPLANPRRLSIITMCLDKINFLTFISKLKNLKCNMLRRFAI